MNGNGAFCQAAFQRPALGEAGTVIGDGAARAAKTGVISTSGSGKLFMRMKMPAPIGEFPLRLGNRPGELSGLGFL